MENKKRLELISRNALMEEVKRCFAPPYTLPTVFSVLSGIVKKAPTIDAVEVVHGRKGESVISKTGLMCTACYSDIDRDAVFCKYCGAKMDGDGNGNL